MIRPAVGPVSAIPALDQPALCCKFGQNPVGCRWGDSAELPHIGILDDIVILQELLDPFPTLCGFILRCIAHFIAQRYNLRERCFDS